MLTVDGGTKSICYAPKAAPDGDYSAHALAVPKLPKDKPLSASATARYVVKDRHGVVQHSEDVPMTKRESERAVKRRILISSPVGAHCSRLLL